MGRATFPFVLNQDLVASLTVSVKIGAEMRTLAAAKGYGPEELENLIAQRFEEELENIKNVLNMNMGEHLE